MSGDKLGPVDIEFFLKNVNFKEEGARMRNEIKGIGNTAQDTNKLLASLVTGFGAYMSFQGISGFGRELINVRGEFQQLGIAFETMLGSKVKSDKLMSETVDLAAKTPYSLREIAQVEKGLIAFGEDASTVADTVTRLGNIASGTGANIGELGQAYGKVMSKGKMQAEELNQFTERGVPIVKELAKMYGVTTGEVYKLVEQGKVGFPELQKVIQNVTNEGGLFYNLMEKQSKSLTGMVSNLGDAWDKMLNSIGQSNEGLLADGISGLTDLVNNYQKVIDVLQVLVVTYGAYKAATIFDSIMRETEAVGGLIEALKKLSIIRAGIGLLGKANPYALALSGITALIGGLVLYSKYSKGAKSATDEINGSISTEVIKLNNVFTSLKNAGEKTDERNRLIKIANEQYGTYLPFLLTEKSTLDDIEAAQRKATEALVADLAVKKANEKIGDITSKAGDKFLKTFSGFTQGYADQFGSNMMSQMLGSLQTEVNNTAASGGDLGEIASRFWNTWLKKLSQSTGYAKFSFDDFYKSFSEAIIDTQGFNKQIEVLQAYSNVYQKLLLGFKSGNEDGPGAPKSKSRTVQIIDAEIAALKKQQTELSSTKKAWEDYNKKIETLEKERISITGDDKDAAKEEKTDKKNQDELLARTASFNEKKLLLDFKYQLERKKLAGKDSNIAELDKQYQEELDALVAANFKKSESYRWVYDNIAKMGRNALNEYIARLRKEINAFKGNEEIKLELTRKLAEAEEKLNTFIPDKLKDAAGMLQEMAGLAGEFNQQLADALNNVAGLATGIAGAMTGFSSGNVFQGFSGIVGALTSITKLAKGNKDSGDGLEKWIAKLTKVIQLQENSLALLSSKDQISAYSKLFDTISGQLDAVSEKTHGVVRDLFKSGYGFGEAWKQVFAKLKIPDDVKQWTDADWQKAMNAVGGDAGKNLELLYQQWLELRKQQQEYINTQNELLTGTTYDSIVGSIVDGFADGLDSAADFADSFEELMRKALLQSLQVQYLEQPLQAWYDQFAAANKDGLTAEEIAALKLAYNTIITNASDYATALETAAGITLENGASSENSMAGAIKGIQEDTASLIAGQMNAMRLLQIEGIQIHKSSLLHLAEISLNTYQLFAMKDILNDIKTAVKGTSPINDARTYGR